VGEAVHVSGIELILKKAHTDLLMMPRVKQLVDQKWEKYARHLFFHQALGALAVLMILTVTVVLQQTPGLGPLGRGMLRAGQWVVLLQALYQGLREVRGMRNEGLRQYWGNAGAEFLEKGMLCVYNSCIYAVVGCKYYGVSHQPLLALACVIAWAYLMYFLLAFEPTGHFVVMLYTMATRDLLRFCLIFATVLTGFSLAFYVLFGLTGWQGLLTAMRICFTGLLGDFDFESPLLLKFPVSANLFAVVYICLGCILLFNLLIAMMGDTYERINQSAKSQWFLERARIIISLEKKLSVRARLSEQNKYWIVVNEQRCLQHITTNAH
jgi:hypothetical protein